MRLFNALLTPTAVAVVLITLLVSWVVWGSLFIPETLWAPGNLSRFHADESSCKDCHRPFKGAMPEKCTVCHDAKNQFNKHENKVAEYHQEFIQTGKNCMTCHTEHRGTEAQITLGALNNPHGDFVYSATGARGCTSCHKLDEHFQTNGHTLNNAIVNLLILRGEGKHRPGNMSDCSRCHSD